MDEVTEKDWDDAITIFSAMTLARAIADNEGSDFEDVLEELFDRAGVE